MSLHYYIEDIHDGHPCFFHKKEIDLDSIRVNSNGYNEITIFSHYCAYRDEDINEKDCILCHDSMDRETVVNKLITINCSFIPR